MTRRSQIEWLLIGLACLGACGQGQSAGPELARWSPVDRPTVVIGVDESRPGHVLHQVLGAVRLSDGRIAIANRGSSEVLFFGTDGSLLKRVGGSGSGPEQFRGIELIGRIAGDTILVLATDPAIATISPEGIVVRKEPFLYPYYALACRGGIGCDMQFMPDGALLLLAPETGTCEPFPLGLSRGTVLLARYDWRARSIDTLGILPGSDRIGFPIGPEGRYVSTIGRPYGRMAVAAATSIAVLAAESGGDSIAVYSSAGDRMADWRLPLEARRVSARAKSIEAPPPPDPARGVVGPREPHDYPDAYPTLARLMADAADNLWVMKYPDLFEAEQSSQLVCPYAPVHLLDGAQWIVLSSSGQAIAEITTPAGLHVLDVGPDYVLGLRRDSLDVQSVAVYAVRR